MDIIDVLLRKSCAKSVINIKDLKCCNFLLGPCACEDC